MKHAAKILAILILLAQGPIGNAQSHQDPQNSLQLNRSAFWFGSRSLQTHPSYESSTDFLNYINNSSFNEFFILGISLQFQYREKYLFSVDAFTADDIVPNSLKLQFTAKPTPWLGLNAGFMRYPFLITGYENFHQEAGFYSNPNTRQRTFHDLSLYGGLGLHGHGKGGFISLNLNLAYGTLLPFTESFVQKEVNSNLRREIIYKGETSSSFLLFPELTAGISLASFNGGTLGLQFHASMLGGKRHIHYSKILRQWTEENQSSETIRNPSHRFTKTDISMGVYWQIH